MVWYHRVQHHCHANDGHTPRPAVRCVWFCPSPYRQNPRERVHQKGNRQHGPLLRCMDRTIHLCYCLYHHHHHHNHKYYPSPNLSKKHTDSTRKYQTPTPSATDTNIDRGSPSLPTKHINHYTHSQSNRNCFRASIFDHTTSTVWYMRCLRRCWRTRGWRILRRREERGCWIWSCPQLSESKGGVW